MLTEQRRNELALLYILYIKALEVRADCISFSCIKSLGTELLQENSDIPRDFTQKDTFVFYRNIVKVFRRIANDNHSMDELRLHEVKQRRIAFFFLLCLTRREFWWIGNYDNRRAHEFSFACNISKKESKKFFELLVEEANRFGHSQNNNLRSIYL